MNAEPEGRRSRLETIIVERPRCPACGGIALKKYRSVRDQGDGTSLSCMLCTACGERFRVVME